MIWEQAGGIGRLTLNRPETLNAWTPEFGSELKRIVEGDAAADSVRSVVVTGGGRAFSSGADLKAGFDPAEDGRPDIRKELHDIYHPVIAGIRRLPKPVIAAVNGPAAGAGLSFACACDLRIASDQASFVPAFVNIGLVPDSGGTFFVTRLVGQARAFEWLASGRRLSAAEAHAWGVVSEVVDAGDLQGRAAAVAAELAKLPTRAIGMTKRLLDRAPTATLDEQLEWETQLQTAATQTADFQEGVAAFLEKRDPNFEGR